MEQRKEQLLKAVKTAAAQFGLDGATTRIISEIAGVNDAYIYRYFKDREELLAQAYKMESNELIKKVNDIAVYCHSSTELHLPDAANIVLHTAWTQLLSDYDACRYCAYYYNSPYFKNVQAFHEQQVEELLNNLDWLFDTRETAKNCLYVLFTNLYTFANQVVDGRMPDDAETEKSVLTILIKILVSCSNRRTKYPNYFK